MVDRIVIVGGGLGGAKSAEALREQGFRGSIHLVAAEAHVPYERPPLSKGYLQGVEDFASAQPHPADWYAEQDIELIRGVRAIEIDRSTSSVDLADGRSLHYDALVLATGSTPRTLGVLGGAAAMTLRHKEDADALRDQFTPGRKVCILGGGWIGLEVAAAAVIAEAEVTVVVRDPVPLMGVVGEQIGEVFAGLHRERGARVLAGVEPTSIERTDGGAPTAVILSDGTRIEADLVLAGIGALPTIDLAAQCGLAVGDGVHVDAQLRTSDPSIYAVGDIAAAMHPFLQTRVRVEHWATALNQAPVAAANILGTATEYDELPFFFSDQYDLGLEYIGYAPSWAVGDVVVRGDLESREFIAFWLSPDGRVLAGMNVNVWDVVDDVKALIHSRKVMDLAALANPDVPLAALVV